MSNTAFLTDWLGRRVSDAELQTVTSRVTETLYYKELALYIARSYIANAISKCEFLVYEDGEEVHNELYYLLNVNPNPNQSSSQFLNEMINRLYNDGEVLVIPHKGKLYVADGYSVEDNPFGEDIYSNVSIRGRTFGKTYKASAVFRFKLDDQNVRRIIDNLYATYNQLMSCAVAAYKRGNGQKYKLVLDNMKAGTSTFAEQFDTKIKDQLKTFIESENAVYPQFRGTDLQVIGSASGATSADVVALRKEIFEFVAQSFKIPLPMMYGNITNMGEIVKVFLTFCIDPLADMISEELTRKTTSFATWNGGRNFVRVDTSRINHIDILEIADKADKLIASGLISVDEGRKLIELQPLGTEFSEKHWVTKNYSSAEDEAGVSDG